MGHAVKGAPPGTGPGRPGKRAYDAPRRRAGAARTRRARAAPAAPELAALGREISGRGAANMRRLAQDLAATGRLRPDLSLDEVADVIWATNAVEFYTLLVLERGWTPERFGRWLAGAWRRL